MTRRGSLASQCHLPSRGCGWCWPPARNLPCSTSGVAARRQPGADWRSEQQAGMRMPSHLQHMSWHAMSGHASGVALLCSCAPCNRTRHASAVCREGAWHGRRQVRQSHFLKAASTRACSQSGPMPETQMAARSCHHRTAGRAKTVLPTAPQPCSQCTGRDDVCASFGNMPCHATP